MQDKEKAPDEDVGRLNVSVHDDADREFDEILARGTRGQKEFVGHAISQVVTAARTREPLGPGTRHGKLMIYSLFHQGAGPGAIAVIIEHEGALSVMAYGMPDSDFDNAIRRALTRAAEQGWI